MKRILGEAMHYPLARRLSANKVAANMRRAMTGALLRRYEKRARQTQTRTNLSRDDNQNRARRDKVFHKEAKRQLPGLVRNHVSVVYVIYCNK